MRLVRIIKKAPIEMELVSQAVMYDGLVDYLTDMTPAQIRTAIADSSVKYLASDTPTRTTPDTILKPAAVGLIQRHTFAGWSPAGEPA